MTGTLHITLAQINPIVGDLTYNRDLILKTAAGAPDKTDLIIFPEMAVSGYPPEDLVLKSFFMRYVHQSVSHIAGEAKKPLLLPSPWLHDGKLYNAVHLIENGRITETRFKRALPNYGVFDEMRLFEAGPLPDPIAFRDHKLGVMICEDMWNKEVSAHLREKGAELLISVNASPFDFEKAEQRIDIAGARAQETSLPLIYVNQCGGQDELVFDGASFVLNEGGRVILQAEEFVTDIHHTIWEQAENNHWICSTDSIAPLHEDCDAIYQALVIGLRDYVGKTGFPGVIIGFSGGIDSALSAAIAVDALGKDAVECVMMPSRYTSQESLDDAAACAKMLGVQYKSYSIESAVEAFENILSPPHSASAESSPTPAGEIKGGSNPYLSGTTHENIQPRCRGLILMALSNAGGRMVLSTGNKSEMAVGYATLYGDMNGGFNALKDVYKTQVYALARWRNQNKPDHGFGPDGPVMPENIITKAPTAELKENQTDQDTLPPYEKLDDILRCLIELDYSVEDITKRGHSVETVQKVWKMLDRAEYKRRQAPPGIKITARAFGRDRRYPIVNHFTKIVGEKN